MSKLDAHYYGMTKDGNHLEVTLFEIDPPAKQTIDWDGLTLTLTSVHSSTGENADHVACSILQHDEDVGGYRRKIGITESEEPADV